MLIQPEKPKGIIFSIEKEPTKEEFDWIQTLGNLEIDTEEKGQIKIWTKESCDIEAIRREILKKLGNKLKPPPHYYF